MHTPTLDHFPDQPARGACSCMPHSLCPQCMGKLQRMRHDWALKQWLETWGGDAPRPGPRPAGRPHLRLVR